MEEAAPDPAPVERARSSRRSGELKHTSLRIEKKLLAAVKIDAIRRDISLNDWLLGAIDRELRSAGRKG